MNRAETAPDASSKPQPSCEEKVSGNSSGRRSASAVSPNPLTTRSVSFSAKAVPSTFLQGKISSAIVFHGGKNFIVDDDLTAPPPRRQKSAPVTRSSSSSSAAAAAAPSSSKPSAATGETEDDKLEAMLRTASMRRSNAVLGRMQQRSIFSWPDVFGRLKRKQKVLQTIEAQDKKEALAASRTAAAAGGGGDDETLVDAKEGPSSTSSVAVVPAAGEARKVAAGVPCAGGKNDNGERDEDEQDADSDGYEEDDADLPWNRRVLRFLLSWEFEVFLLFLLVCDVILLIVELELSTKKLCRITWDTAAIASTKGLVDSGTALGVVNCTNATAISYSCEHGRSFQLPPQFSVCPFYVVEELTHALHVAEIGIAWASRGILITFGLELLCLLFVAGPSIFMLHKLYLLDAFIIATSVVLDIVAALFLHDDTISELIVLARVWRFARIVHGVGVSVHDVDEHEVAPEEGSELYEKVLHETDPECDELRKILEKKEKMENSANGSPHGSAGSGYGTGTGHHDPQHHHRHGKNADASSGSGSPASPPGSVHFATASPSPGTGSESKQKPSFGDEVKSE